MAYKWIARVICTLYEDLFNLTWMTPKTKERNNHVNMSSHMN